MAELKDSGNRRDFGTGAVRDMAEGKGRCDLLPLDVVKALLGNDPVIQCIAEYQKDGCVVHLCQAIWSLHGAFQCVSDLHVKEPLFPDIYTMLLEVAIHFEDGARKYGDNNWRNGIPAKCYIDSAIRHYLKYRRGDRDEPHHRACAWNLLCCIWELEHHDQKQYEKPSEDKVESGADYK